MNWKDIAGQRFGLLVVLSLVDGSRTHWHCACDCGNAHIASGVDLRSGHTLSCRCYNNEAMGNRFRTHGLSKTPTYYSWVNMQTRCTNKNVPAFKDYGARGIAVCDRWKLFANFVADMGVKPEGMTLERIDNDGNYEAGNCRWATRKEQNTNQRSTLRFITLDGSVMSGMDVARFIAMPKTTFFRAWQAVAA